MLEVVEALCRQGRGAAARLVAPFLASLCSATAAPAERGGVWRVPLPPTSAMSSNISPPRRAGTLLSAAPVAPLQMCGLSRPCLYLLSPGKAQHMALGGTAARGLLLLPASASLNSSFPPALRTDAALCAMALLQVCGTAHNMLKALVRAPAQRILRQFPLPLTSTRSLPRLWHRCR